MSGDTVFLVIRQGDYCLCLHREEGHFPVKVFTTDVGGRRLLGLGAGGLALIALGRVDDATLRGCGVSGNKLAAVNRHLSIASR